MLKFFRKQSEKDAIPKNAIHMASYPRSGNTWVRRLVTDVILQGEGFNTEAKLPIHQNNVIPIIRKNVGKYEIDPGISLTRPLIKTHDEYATGLEYVFFYRDPTDCLVSYYHYKLRIEKQREAVSKMGIDKFCRDTYPEWESHFESYMLRAEALKFIFSYEELLADTVKVLKEICSAAEVNWTDQIIEKAVENQAFEKLSAMEESGEKAKKGKFFRKGSSGSGAEELAEATYQEIQGKRALLLQRFGR